MDREQSRTRVVKLAKSRFGIFQDVLELIRLPSLA